MNAMHKLLGKNYMRDDFPFWIIRMRQGSVEEHVHDFIELVFVVRGGGRHRFEGETYDIRSGDVFIINPGEAHAYEVRQGERMEIINCLFQPSLLPDAFIRGLGVTNEMDYFYVHPFLSTEQRFNHRLNLQGEDAERALGLLKVMQEELAARGTGYQAVIRLKLLELLILLSRYYVESMAGSGERQSAGERERQLLARRAYGYLERNYDKKLPVASIAELFNVSARHLNRLMQAEYGKSVLELLHDIRIARAKRYLAETDEKIISIALMVGYDDPSFFTRLFQRHVGCSPSQYRAGAKTKTGSSGVQGEERSR